MVDALSHGYALPQGFRFPDSYAELFDGPELPDLDPWWFLATNPELAVFWSDTLRKQYPTRSLVPFAKRDDVGDELAAFDGSDGSGNPKVYYVHAYADPGWEHRGEAKDFSDWLQEAKAVSEEWKKQQ